MPVDNTASGSPDDRGRAAGTRAGGGSTPGDDGGRSTHLRRPVGLVLACAVILLEGALMLTLAVLAVVALVRGPAQVPGAMVFFAAFSALVAVVLAASARALWRDRRWARSPVLTWQVLLLVMAVGWLGVERTIGAAVVLGAAVMVTVCLLLPSVVAVTTGRTTPTERHRGGSGDHGPMS